MGEVHRARDARLDRIVAIKVFPPGGADDPDRLRRHEEWRIPQVRRGGWPAKAKLTEEMRRKPQVSDAWLARPKLRQEERRIRSGAKVGEPPESRTRNQQIKSLLLCQLS